MSGQGSGSRLGIVVVNYGSHELVARNIGGLALDPLDHRVVVVDNFSSASERAAISGAAGDHGWELVALPANLGFGAGMNAGVARARELGCDVFLLVNPDLSAEPAVIRALVEHCRRYPMTMLSPRILRPDGSEWFAGGTVLVDAGRAVTRGADSSGEHGWLSGACLTVHERLWSLLGGFDEDYFLYWEDVDLSWRCTAAGGTLLVRHDLEVVHSVGGTQGAGKSTTYYRYNCRNRLLFAAKHLDRRRVGAWIVRTPAHARLVLLRGGRRQFLHRPWRPLGAALAGSAQGIIIALQSLCARSRAGNGRAGG